MKTKKPFYKRWQFLIILLVLSIIIKRFDNVDSQKQTTVQANKSIEQQTQTLEEKIKEFVTDKFGEKELLELYLVDDALTEDRDDKIVNLKIHEYPTRISCFGSTAKLMEELFKDKRVSEVLVVWHGEFTDTYENTKVIPAMKVRLRRDIAEKINWENFDITKFPSIANQYWEHDGIEK